MMGHRSVDSDFRGGLCGRWAGRMALGSGGKIGQLGRSSAAGPPGYGRTIGSWACRLWYLDGTRSTKGASRMKGSKLLPRPADLKVRAKPASRHDGGRPSPFCELALRSRAQYQAGRTPPRNTAAQPPAQVCHPVAASFSCSAANSTIDRHVRQIHDRGDPGAVLQVRQGLVLFRQPQRYGRLQV